MNATLNVRTDRRVKERAHRLAENLGISLDAVVNAYLRQFIRSESLHYIAAPRMSKKLVRMLGPIERDIKAGRNIDGPFRTPQEIDAYFDAL